ncbi:pentapeptide repeat-containing protein [Leptolyngbya sp. FACHB-261]|uniref:pentapeptide repeat-containing protein n=1 Tax=Leptolyngbya sp. FACHB-261 TaxID=2692806 RepID=UPI001683C738|nr:pentapeptide repeat-containing protein [Leptolyngbya sp. FACHB-261]MBD2102964.1 pentapeptide repeat-containing protein [Leptolyngbya sp. FACHB-261]
MSSSDSTPIKQPVSFLYKPVKLDFKELFKALTKTAVNVTTNKLESVPDNLIDAAAALGLDKKPEEVAWALVARSLFRAMRDLMQERPTSQTHQTKDFEGVCEELASTLEMRGIVIDPQFFDNPKASALTKTIQKPFVQWLRAFGLSQSEANTIAARFPSYFTCALDEEWAEHPEVYACLKPSQTPFTDSAKQEQGWRSYSAWLQKEIDKPLLTEAFSLSQVYIAPRAYYEREKGQGEQEPRSSLEKAKFEKVVVDLERELEAWLGKAAPKDWIRVISGGPGSGKSSFTKAFAAKQAEKAQIPVLLIPLHRFKISDDLVEAVGKFVRSEHFLSRNPLDHEHGESRLLIIFDGLDELAMQGKAVTEAAQQFIDEVCNQLLSLNRDKTRLQVLISSRDLVIQDHERKLKRLGQILHVLPYFLPKNERERFIDLNSLLGQDQRQSWWELYGKANGKDYAALPSELNRDDLTEITSQPLLNYLVALAFNRGELNLTGEINLNGIYGGLLQSIYKRVWTDEQHPTLDKISEEEFTQVLEEIGLTVWHGNGRTATLQEIQKRLKECKLADSLEAFSQSAESGVTNLLIAFYFRRSGSSEQGENTFEFTHKSFGEYLTTRKIVGEVENICEELKRYRRNPRQGRSEQELLQIWVRLCGPTAIDFDLLRFVRDEVHLAYTQQPEEVRHWQQVLCCLIRYMLQNGMPMETLISTIPTFYEANRQARNAEEALLVMLNACAIQTQIVSEIDWPSPVAFGEWLSRLHGQRVLADVLALNCLSFLNLSGCILFLRDFVEVNLRKANLREANLGAANLEGANLARANLARANLARANLKKANLEGAILKKANLEGAILEGADLEDANLEGADLEGANLAGANLEGADLEGAILAGAILIEANLTGANLEGANLEGAYLEGAYLEDANLEGANLEDANLEGANLEGADLEGADLAGANLEGAYLEGADLEDANLAGANLEGAYLGGMILKGVKLDKNGHVLPENLQAVEKHRAWTSLMNLTAEKANIGIALAVSKKVEPIAHLLSKN